MSAQSAKDLQEAFRQARELEGSINERLCSSMRCAS